MLDHIRQLVVDLKLTLGPLYEVSLASDKSIEINTPFLNQINDNYRVFVQELGNNYVLDDDGDALNEFTLLNLPKVKAIAYLKENNIELDDGAIVMECEQDQLIRSILALLHTQMGLTSILQLETLKAQHKLN